jgi:hypothetical protein
MDIVNWIISHWTDIAGVIASVIGTASIIVRLTPTLKDDNILLPIIKFIGKYIALNVNAPTERPN